MIRGSSRTSGSSDAPVLRHPVWRAALVLYAVAAIGDFAYHLLEELRTENEAIEISEVAVAFSAALFWPVDLIAMALLALR